MYAYFIFQEPDREHTVDKSLHDLHPTTVRHCLGTSSCPNLWYQHTWTYIYTYLCESYIVIRRR